MTGPADEEFARCLTEILRHEGGYVNRADDPGGETNLGITKLALENWLGRDVTSDAMKRLSVNDAAPIYRARYFDVCSCERLPPGLSLVIFDTAVNQGPSRARRWLQRALGVPPDGQIGPKTMLALRGCDPADIIRKVCRTREAAYRALETFPTFGKGWLRRLKDVEAKALKWAAEA